MKMLYACVALFISGGNIALTQASQRTDKHERVISFSGYDWLVKSSPNSETFGPGNNHFSDSSKNVWIDNKGWLHLKITHRNGKWYCAEVILLKPLGYKKYIFQINGRVDRFHQNVVGGLFTYLDGMDGAEEIDIEFSGWGNDKNLYNAHYAIQPSDNLGNVQSFNFDLSENAYTYSFDWKCGKVDFTSYQGQYSSVPTDSSLVIRAWSYSGKNVPSNQNCKVHINLWLFQRDKIGTTDHPKADMIITSFLAL